MRIYFIGSHSTGKTTLARYTSNLKKLPLLTEVARTILAEKELHVDSLRADLNVVNDYQKEVFLRQLAEEKKYPSFVSDRSFDCLAYTAQHSTILNEVLKTKELTDYVNSLKDPNVKLFFVRPSKATLKNDGVREHIVWDNIVAIDAMIKFMVEMWKIPCIQVSTDSMQERVRLIESIIS
ncbi:MAG TPA: AAA family ATPase [Anaerovoracaceae bacterium]|nr:AAA family ATPase [Anaerovoracaceae bacterium]